MISDPNWLYSTIAQSSAAIVAILGGFITASLLMLLAEKRSIMNQLKDREARLDGLVSRSGGLFGGGGGFFGISEKDDSEKFSKSFREDEISSLEQEVKSLEDRLNILGYPKNLGWGIAVLSYLAVFGILSPILVMAFNAFFTWIKVLVVVTFSFGIVGLLSYIITQMKALRK
jgi:hypothetical protein